MDKKKLISEELKRHMELLEYTFYMEDETNDDLDTEDLLLGAEKLYEQDPVPTEDETEVEDPFATEDETETETETDPFSDDSTTEVEDEFAEEETTGDDTVEVDVTDIVAKSEQTRTEIEGLTSKMDELLGKLCLLYTSPSPRDPNRSRMPSSA